MVTMGEMSGVIRGWYVVGMLIISLAGTGGRFRREHISKQYMVSLTGYITTHFDFDFDFCVLIGAGVSGSRVCRNQQTRFVKRRSTFCTVFMETSMNPMHPN